MCAAIRRQMAVGRGPLTRFSAAIFLAAAGVSLGTTVAAAQDGVVQASEESEVPSGASSRRKSSPTGAEQPGAPKSGAQQPGAAKSGAAKPSAAKPSAAKPSIAKPVAKPAAGASAAGAKATPTAKGAEAKPAAKPSVTLPKVSPSTPKLGRVTVEPASLKGVAPGVSTIAQLKQSWGEPQSTATQDGQPSFVYVLPGFKQIDVLTTDGKVSGMVLQFTRSFSAAEVVKQLKFEDIEPVTILDETGKPLGQSFPERGVVFSFDGDGKSQQVSQLLLEGITAEPFVVRAESRWQTRPQASLEDVTFAVGRTPENAKAHWLRARILTHAGRHAEALKSAAEAVALEPTNHAMRLTHAQAQAGLGQSEAAARTLQTVIDDAQVPPLVKARALCQRGDLAVGGPRDYKAALQHYMQSAELAETLIEQPDAAARREAKHVVVDSHLGAAYCIGWGTWNKKEQVVPKWLSRATEVGDDLIRKEQVSADLKFSINRRMLAAMAGVKGRADLETLVQTVENQSRQLASQSSDKMYTARIHADAAQALYEAMLSAHARNQSAQALQYGDLAMQHLDQAAQSAPRLPEHDYLAGQLLFRTGAVHAVLNDKHAEAITWYTRAIPLLEKPVPGGGLVDPVQQGEAFISMGVSFWQTGAKQRAVQLTSEGVHLYEQAVTAGQAQETQLEIPYSNLANMHRELGNATQSKRFAEMAAKVKQGTRRE